MKLNVDVNADETLEDLKVLADEFLGDLLTGYLPYLYLLIVVLVISLVLTSCCGALLAIRLHRSCHCRRCRCCFWIECGREQEQHNQQHKQRLRQFYNTDDDEIYV